MSASFLNLASAPGAGAQAAGGQGIAQQATQAAQAKGPLAGFEALLAAFFGDQGLTPPAGQATATAALLGGQTAPKTNGKGDGAGGKGSKDCASPDAAATDATGGSGDPTDASGLAVDGALPLIAPTIPLDAAAAATAGN